jgi:hypothetical protein
VTTVACARLTVNAEPRGTVELPPCPRSISAPVAIFDFGNDRFELSRTSITVTNANTVFAARTNTGLVADLASTATERAHHEHCDVPLADAVPGAAGGAVQRDLQLQPVGRSTARKAEQNGRGSKGSRPLLQ